MGYITIAEYDILTDTTITADHTAVYVQGIVDAVSTLVDTYCMGTLFTPTTMTDERNESYVQGKSAKLVVKLQWAPLISVGTLKYRIGSTDTELTNVSDADLDLVQSIIYLQWYGPLYRRSQAWVTVTTYMAGHVSVPDTVKHAVALLVQEWVEADDRAGGGSSSVLVGYRLGNYSEQYAQRVIDASIGNIGLGTTRSMLASQLLGQYRRPGVARSHVPIP